MTVQSEAGRSFGETPEVLLSASRRPTPIRSRPAISTWLSLSRILLMPVISGLLLTTWVYGTSLAAVLFIAAAITDTLDGYFARRQRVVSTLGVYFDLTADKLLVSGVLIAMVAISLVPAWIVITIVSREFLIVGVRMFAAAEGVVMPAAAWGKGKTVVTLAGMAALIIRADQARGGLAARLDAFGPVELIVFLAWPMMILAVALTAISGLYYLRRALPLLAVAAGQRGMIKHDQADRRENR